MFFFDCWTIRAAFLDSPCFLCVGLRQQSTKSVPWVFFFGGARSPQYNLLPSPSSHTICEANSSVVVAVVALSGSGSGRGSGSGGGGGGGGGWLVVGSR